jgi:cytoskeletal protein CcmA (bactofilin family)
VHGDGEIAGGLNLAVTGVWNGYIQAQQAIVAGKITGGLTVQGKLEIGYTAVIRGKVSARTIAIAKGAIVDGEIEVTSDAPMLRIRGKARRMKPLRHPLCANGDSSGKFCVLARIRSS